MIEKLARELSYIEALRDRYCRVQYINAQLTLLSQDLQTRTRHPERDLPHAGPDPRSGRRFRLYVHPG